jgi:hypothetical protein
VNGGIQFGGTGLPPTDDPIDLVTDPAYMLDFPINTDTIAAALATCAEQNRGYDWSQLPALPECFTWNDGGTLFLGATLTSYAAPGLISGDVTLAADLRFDADGGLPNLRFAGNGNINVFGFPVGTAGFLLAFDDPLAPRFDIAFRAPGGRGNPLGFLLPARGDIAMRIDTTGIALGSLLATQAFAEALADGTLELAGDVFDDALEHLAARLQSERHLLLTRRLLDHPTIAADTVITSTFILDRLLGRNGVPGLLPATIPSDPDELRALLVDVSDVLSALQEALFSQIATMAEGADGLGLDLVAFANDPIYALTVANSLVSQQEAAALAAYGRFAQDVLKGALADAGSAFSEQFDPMLVITGELQPMLLGVPMGEPTEQVTFAVSRRSAVLSARTSPSTMFLTVLNAATATLAQLNAQFGLSETLEIGAQLPLEGLVDTLFEAGPLAIDPFSPEWSVTVEAGLRLAGLEIASLSGVVVSPDNETLLCTKVHKTWETGPARCAIDGIPVTSPENYAKILEHGGILVTGQLDAPELVVDPVSTVDAIVDLVGEPPESILDYPRWIGEIAGLARGLRDVGQFQLFVPGFTNLIDPNYDGSIWSVDYDRGDEADRFNFRVPASELEQRLLDVIADAYVDGVWDVRLLGIDLTRGTLTASPSGYQVRAEVPFLADPVTFQLGGSSITVGPEEEFWPSALLDVELDRRAVADLLTSIGAPSILQVPGDATGRLRVATPGYDLDSVDPLLVRGGVGARLALDLPPFVQGADFDIVVLPPAGAPSPFAATVALPDLIATARVGSIGPLAGVTITGAEIELRRLDGEVSMQIRGSAKVAGATVSVDAQLAGDLTGSIGLTGATGTLVLGGFTIEGGARLDLVRDRPGDPLTITFRSDLTVTLPAWLSQFVGTSTVTADGTFSGDGTVDITLGIDELTIPGTGLRITGANAKTPATVRLLRSPGGPLAVAIDGAIDGSAAFSDAVGSALTVSGSLDGNGDGFLVVSFDRGELRAGSFRLVGAGSIERQGSQWRVQVNGQVSIPGVVTAAAAAGTIDQDGLVSATVTATPLTVGPVSLSTASASIVRAQGSWTLSVNGTGTIPGIPGSFTMFGNLDGNGFGMLSLTASTMTVATGFSVTGGPFTLVRDAAGTRLTVGGSLGFANNTLTVSGQLVVGTTATTGELGLSVPTFAFYGWQLTGSFSLVVTPEAGSVSVTANVAVPGIGTSLAVSGDLDRFARGVLAMQAQSLPLPLGGANSQLRASGTFQLSRTLQTTSTGGTTNVVRFGATGASLEWTGVRTFTVPDLVIASNGAIDTSVTAASVTAGVFTLTPPSVRLVAGSNGANARLEFGESQLAIASMATGSNQLTVPGFSIGVSGNFTRNLFDSTDVLGLDALQLEARFAFERVDGVFQFRIRERSNGGQPRLRIIDLTSGSVELDVFTIRSNGTFETTVRSNRIGPNALSIRNATMDLRKTGQALSTLRLRISGGQLYPRVGTPVSLPTIDITTDGTFDFEILRILDFGERLKSTENRKVAVTLDNGLLALELKAPAPLASFPGSSLQLTALRVASDGTFTGTVEGSLSVHGLGLGQVTMALSRSGDNPRVRLDIEGTASAQLAPNTFQNIGVSGSTNAIITGYLRSDGSFDLQGTVIGNLTWAPIDVSLVTFTGTGSIRLRPWSVTAKVAGIATVPLLPSATIPEKTVKASGAFALNVFDIVDFPLLKPWSVPQDTVPPTMAQPSDVIVYADFGTSTAIPVEYPVPAATDDRSTPTVTCTPASGTLFGEGEKTVTCTAADASNNTTTRTFKVTVVRTDQPPAEVSGSTLSFSAAGFEPASKSDLMAFSDPVRLGSVVADDEGTVRGSVRLPAGFPAGLHHLVISGTAPDGAPMVVVIPFTVPTTILGGPAPVITPPSTVVDRPVPQPPSVPPAGTLPGTGRSGGPAIALLAMLVLLLGAALRITGRARRRGDRLASSGYAACADGDRRARNARHTGGGHAAASWLGQGAGSRRGTGPGA